MKLTLVQRFSKDKLFGFFIFIIILLLVFYLFTGSIEVFLILGIAGLIIFLWATELSKLKYSEILLLLFLISGIMVNSVATGSDIMLSGLVVLSFAIASAIVTKSVSAFIAKSIYIIFIDLMIFYIFFLNRIDSNIFAAGSRNYISAVSIYLSAHIYLAYNLEGKNKPNLWPALITFLFSIWATGRSGIAVSGMLLFVVLIFRYKANKKARSLFYILLIITFLLYYIFHNQINHLFLKSFQASRFYFRGLDTPRYEIWKSFFSALNIKRALLGVDLMKIPLIADFNGNPHNSFIKVWARIGLPGLYLDFIILIALFKIWKKSVFLALVYSLMLLRAFFDIIILFNILDYVFFSYLFYAFRKES